MAKIIQVEQTTLSSDDIQSMMSTFNVSDEVGMVLVPLNLFIGQPTAICDAFNKRNRQIIHNEQLINVFMENDKIFPSDYGKMDALTRTWTLVGTTGGFLDHVIGCLSKRTTMLSMTLQRHNIQEKDTDIEFVLFIKPSSGGMKSLIDNLHDVKCHLSGSKKFAVEVDFGPTIERWARGVLGQDMTCIGGRLGITSGDLFNPLFKWNVVVGFLPCLPFSLLASLVYRASRKVKYIENKLKPEEVVCILGSNSLDILHQREALSDLTRIALSIPVNKCIRCGLLLWSEDATAACSCHTTNLRYIRRLSTAQQQTTSFCQNDSERSTNSTPQALFEPRRFTPHGSVDKTSTGNKHRKSNTNIEIDFINEQEMSRVDW